MFTRRLVVQGAILGFLSAASIGQQTPPASSSPSPVLREFPVVLQQNVETGKTPVGAKVQAKLAAATLFDGTVIPKNAVMFGVVVESEAKSAKDRARLAIRMDSAHWNGGWAPIKAYLMPLYYPTTAQAAQGLPNGSPASTVGDEADQRSSSESPMQHRPFSDSSSETTQGAIPDTPTISNRPVRMKNVTLAPAADGGIALVSEHANVKLYKLTTYVFAADEASAR
jgi:hypothetical protein